MVQPAHMVFMFRSVARIGKAYYFINALSFVFFEAGQVAVIKVAVKAGKCGAGSPEVELDTGLIAAFS